MNKQYEQLVNHAKKIQDKVDSKYTNNRLSYILTCINKQDYWMAQHEINMLWNYFINRNIPNDMR